jgi:hypothetical protein
VTSPGVTAPGVDWVRGAEQPLDGQTRIEVRSWDQLAFDRRGVFRESLRDLGLSEADVRDALKLRDTALRHANKAVSDFWADHPHSYFTIPPEVEREVNDVYGSARDSGLRRLRDWFSGRSIRVDEVEQLQIRLPLFVLAAASVPGCSARFATETTQEGQLEWSVTIYGTGLGSGGSVTTSVSAEFSATSGETKVIFLPVTVKVERVTVLEHGRRVGRGRRVDASNLQSQQQSPGLLLLAADAVPPVGKVANRFPLSGDTSGAIATYGYRYQAGNRKNLQLGLKAFGADIKVKTEVMMQRDIRLSYGLRGGSDYELYRLADGDGLLWAATPASSS